MASVEFDATVKVLGILIDFKPGSRFAVSGHGDTDLVRDGVGKNYRYLSFFQHEAICLQPRVREHGGTAGRKQGKRKAPSS